MTALLHQVQNFLGLTDHRFEGWTNDELADAIDSLNSGKGAQSIAPSVEALQGISKSMYHIDTTLHDQLKTIGVSWRTDQSSELAKTAMAESKSYAGNTQQQVTGTADTVQAQATAFARARNAMPDSATLRDSSRPSYLFGGNGDGTMTTHGEQDATQVASQQRAARDQALDAWNGYHNHSTSSIDSHQPLPQSPPVHVAGPPVASGTSTASAGPLPTTGPVSSTNPIAGGGGGGFGGGPTIGGSSGTPLPGGGGGFPLGGGQTSVPIGTGAAPGLSNVPGIGPVAGGGQGGGFIGAPAPGPGPSAPGVGAGPGSSAPINGGSPGGGAGPMARGPISGAGPLPSGEVASGAPAAAATGAGVRGISSAAMNEAAMGSAIATGTGGAGMAGAAAERDRLSPYRGAPGGVVEEDESGVRRNAFGEPEEPAAAAKAASAVAAEPREQGSMLEPATGRQEEEGTRIRRYGVDSEDLFHEENLVSKPVLGDQD